MMIIIGAVKILCSTKKQKKLRTKKRIGQPILF